MSADSKKIGLLMVGLLVSGLFVALGNWQLGRANEKTEALTRFTSRAQSPAVNLAEYNVRDIAKRGRAIRFHQRGVPTKNDGSSRQPVVGWSDWVPRLHGVSDRPNGSTHSSESRVDCGIRRPSAVTRTWAGAHQLDCVWTA